jgi:Ca2+-binding EF-hand superfamily protein
MICEQIGIKAAQKFNTVREAFRYLDADHDGKISRSEMQYFFRAYNFTNQTADLFFDRLDGDGSGEVEYSEFMKYIAPYVQPENNVSGRCSPECSSGASTRTPSPTQAGYTRQLPPVVNSEIKAMLEFIGAKARQKYSHAREVFRCVDCNDDGRISRGEMKYFCRVFNLSEAQADQLFDFLVDDVSKDVGYYDFVRFAGPYLDMPGVAAAMMQEPDSAKLSSKNSSRRTSNTGSEPNSAKLSSKTSWVPSSADSNCSIEKQEHSEPTAAEIEKEMRDIMKDIGEKLPLKFRHVRDAFRPLDLSHNGKITRSEMRSFLRGFGWPHHVADRLFKVLDDDLDGQIDYNVFMSHFDAVLGPANRPAQRGELVAETDDQLKHEVNQIAALLSEKLLTKFNSAREALRTLDLTNDGKITRSDMKLFFRTMCMPVDAANRMFNGLCKDGASTVEYEDFLALFGPVEGPGGRWRTVQELKGSPRPQIWTIL